MSQYEHDRELIPEETPRVPEKRTGCFRLILFFLTLFWILLITFLSMGTNWMVEQTLFDGSLTVSDFRWIVQLFYSFAVFLPTFILSLVVKQQHDKNIYKMWALSGVLSLLVIPSRLTSITASQLNQFILIAGITISILFLGRLNRGIITAKNIKIQKPDGKSGVILLLVSILAIPWFLWGALGSVLDTFLGLTVGFLFALNTIELMKIGMPPYFGRENTDAIENGEKVFPGLAISTSILIQVSAIGLNGNQWLLYLILPLLGLYAARLAKSETSQTIPSLFSPIVLLLGLVASLPLVWMDADELMMITTIGSGELMGVAFRLSLLTLVMEVLIYLVYLLLEKKRGTIRLIGKFNWLVACLGWGILIAVYFIWGTPGFYGEHLFVVMKTQAVLPEIDTVIDADERREHVYHSLVEFAETSQEDIRSQLDRYRIAYTPYYLVNGLDVNGGPLIRMILENRPDVDRVLSSPYLRPLPEEKPVEMGSIHELPEDIQWNLELIRAEEVWNSFGITGKGVVIGQSDSGVDAEHMELSDSYRGKNGDEDYNWYDPWNGSVSPVDHGSHGTHTLGTILGNHVGVAPDAEWIGCVNLGRNLGNPAYYLECMQFMLAPFPQGGNSFTDGKSEIGAQILNNSWGCPDEEGCDSSVFLPAVQALRKAGIFFVASAGNSGYSGCGSVDTPPSIYDDVYSVGSINHQSELSDFSSLGPVLIDDSYRIKPDILAPGEDVLSSYPDDTYEIASGTSMAGPHIAGVVALMWSASPKLMGDVDKTEELLNVSTNDFDGEVPACIHKTQYPNNAAGYGIVDAFEAVKLALEYENK